MVSSFIFLDQNVKFKDQGSEAKSSEGVGLYSCECRLLLLAIWTTKVIGNDKRTTKLPQSFFGNQSLVLMADTELN